MKFSEAIKLMKDGKKMKLPSWGGYWTWDSEKETIVIHTREVDSDTGKSELDIRETQRVEYTLMNICSDEWQEATSENCTILGGQPKFDFGTAMKYLKRGLKVKRIGWNGKEQYIELATNISYKTMNGEIINVAHENMGNRAVAFNGTSGIQLGWLASQADILSEDWTFA